MTTKIVRKLAARVAASTGNTQRDAVHRGFYLRLQRAGETYRFMVAHPRIIPQVADVLDLAKAAGAPEGAAVERTIVSLASQDGFSIRLLAVVVTWREN